MTRLLAALPRVALGALFVWAASVKLPDMAAFAEDLANYRLLPPALVTWVAVAVVGVEITAGVALVAGVVTRAAAAITALLLLAFMGAISQAVVRGVNTRCGCFGGDDVVSFWRVAEDAALLALAAAAFVIETRRERRVATGGR